MQDSERRRIPGGRRSNWATIQRIRDQEAGYREHARPRPKLLVCVRCGDRPSGIEAGKLVCDACKSDAD